MKPIKKLFVYWVGIDVEPAVIAISNDYFEVKPNTALAYGNSRLLIEFFEDYGEERPNGDTARVDGFIRCLNKFNAFATKLSAKGDIHMLLRVETDKEEFIDCLLYRPSGEKSFQIVYEKGLDGNKPSRFAVNEEEKSYFADFMDPELFYEEADQKEWKESISTVVRNGIVHALPAQ